MSKEKLVELIGNAPFGINKQTLIDHHKESVVEELADYLLANGVIVPTVNLGDKVWCLIGGEVCEAVVIKVEYNFYTTPNEWITVRVYSSYYGAYEDKSRIDLMLGKTVFLTREEAEAKLKEEGR